MAKKKGKKATKPSSTFKLTYTTMYNPPELLHQRYERALKKVKNNLGQDHPMLINGKDVRSREKFEDRSPINKDWLLGTFQKGNNNHAQQALSAARKAFP
ncbi:MAG: hypothetical protein KAJ55_17380, partial [Anaerolineales bacterium]|nr:hypothetical protein [Anaerolineales bacterium]